MDLLFKYAAPITPTNATVGDTDFKEFYPRINTNMAWSEIKPYVEQATEDFIIPYIGQTLYDAIAAKFQAGTTLSTIETRYLRLMKTAAAYYTAAYSYSKELDISSSVGAAQNTTDGATPTPQWVFRQKLYDLTKTADKKLDTLLAYLDTQNLLVTSAKTTTFFRTLGEFEAYHDLNGSHKTFRSLRTLITNAIDLFIIPQIGEDTLNDLSTQYTAKTLTAANIALLPYLQKALAKLAVSLACTMPAYTIEGAFIFAMSNTEGFDGRTENAKLQSNALDAMSQSTAAIGKKYVGDLVNFLYKNADTYPLFKAEKMPTSDAKNDNIIYTGAGGIGIF